MKCFFLQGDRWVEHAEALAGCTPAAAAVAATALRLRAGDGLPGEVMMPGAAVSVQRFSFQYKL